MRKIITGLLVLAICGAAWVELVEAADPAASDQSNQIPSSSAPSPGAQGGPAGAPSGQGEPGACCKAGDTTPPTELVAKVPLGQLHSPYPDYAKLAKDDPDLVKQFRLPGCNECHGGTGGGGFCPALTQGVWLWGNTDDVLFRLVTLGSAALEKQGFNRYQYGTVHGPMPGMGMTIATSDQLWKIIAFIRSINPPGTNPPEKVVFGKDARVAQSITALADQIAELGAPKIEGKEAVGGKDAPALYFGSTKMNNNLDAVHKVAEEGGEGMAASLFVKGEGDEYIRVATTLPKALGSVLGGPAFDSISAGKPYYGEAPILGIPSIAGYEPIKDASGAIIGVYGVGYKK
jgi:mono/diheme cytochrome c family protein